MKGKCPRCNDPYAPGPTHPKRKTRDHVLPQARGGTYSVIHGDVRNLETMCADCNEFRAQCGHCWGAVACVDTVARDTRSTRSAVYHQWKLGHQQQIVAAIDAGGTFRSIPPMVPDAREEYDSRRTRNREAVRLGMTVHRIGVDEFIWPADTAAKRVWNLATLARGGWNGPGPRQ